MSIKKAVAITFRICGLLVGVLYLPQAYNIYVDPESAAGVSLLTFGFFFLTQIIAVAHGIFQKDKTLIWTFLFALVGSGTVVGALIWARYAT